MDKYISLTTQGIDAYLQALTDINWFDFKQNDKQEIFERLTKQGDNKNFVFCLYKLWFDSEGFEDDEPYRSLLDEILEIIGLKTLSKNVNYDTDNNLVNISLTTEKSSYDYKINLDDFGDWIDENFINVFINEQVLDGENIDNRFLALPMSDQTVQFVFIPQSTYDKAVGKGIIPEELNYFMTDIDD